MSPPIPISDIPPPPKEHHYILNEAGRPVEVSVIYIPPSSDEQFHEIEMGDKQLDFLEEMIQNAEVKNAVISLNKTRRKLFRENGLLKKRMQSLEYQLESIRVQIDALQKQKQKEKS